MMMVVDCAATSIGTAIINSLVIYCVFVYQKVLAIRGNARGALEIEVE